VQPDGYLYLYHRMATGGQRRASIPETVGAWLRLWTPPRDVVVPDVPVRTLLACGAATLVVLGALVALIAPRNDESKDRRSAAEATQLAADRAARRREQIVEQRPRRASAASLLPAEDAPEAAKLSSRAALIREVEEKISADARARAAAGELRAVRGPTECEPYPKGARPEADLSAARGAYDCLVLLRPIAATNNNIGGALGYPFRAVVDFETFRFAWCKTNPIPGERLVPDPRTVVELPRACRAG
jgi:hypothetical protein